MEEEPFPVGSVFDNEVRRSWERQCRNAVDRSDWLSLRRILSGSLAISELPPGTFTIHLFWQSLFWRDDISDRNYANNFRKVAEYLYDEAKDSEHPAKRAMLDLLASVKEKCSSEESRISEVKKMGLYNMNKRPKMG